MREAHLRDAVALCGLLSFLEKEVCTILSVRYVIRTLRWRNTCSSVVFSQEQ